MNDNIFIFQTPGVYIIETEYPLGNRGNNSGDGGIIVADKITVYASNGTEIFTNTTPGLVGNFMKSDSGVWVEMKGTDEGELYVTTKPDNRVHTFHNAAKTAVNGTEFVVDRAKDILISISGSSVSHRLVFEEGDEDGNFSPITAMRRSDLLVASETGGTNEKWVVDVSGAASFRVRIAAISAGGGTGITVKATVISTV